MSCFDSIMFTCPGCDSEIEVQSKAGDCLLAVFDPERVPKAVADDILGETVRCDDCMGRYVIKIKRPTSLVPLTLEEV